MVVHMWWGEQQTLYKPRPLNHMAACACLLPQLHSGMPAVMLVCSSDAEKQAWWHAPHNGGRATMTLPGQPGVHLPERCGICRGPDSCYLGGSLSLLQPAD